MTLNVLWMALELRLGPKGLTVCLGLSSWKPSPDTSSGRRTSARKTDGSQAWDMFEYV